MKYFYYDESLELMKILDKDLSENADVTSNICIRIK